MKTYDIYKDFRVGNEILFLPNIVIPESDSDVFVPYERLDKLANDYYNNPKDYKLILMANPKYTYEFDIPEGTIIRIPFPRESAIIRYKNEVNLYKRLNI